MGVKAVKPILVGERTTIRGSKKFRELILSGCYEEAVELAICQLRSGAQLFDLNLACRDRDEAVDLERFLICAKDRISAPLMIESAHPHVFELGLKLWPHEIIINFISYGSKGEKKWQEVVPLVREYGAKVVVVTTGAKIREQKLVTAKRAYERLTEQEGIPPEKIIFDPVVFRVKMDRTGAGAETLAGMQLIKEALPTCQTLIGISDISYGLPPAGRQIMNSVFYDHAAKAGLDYAIVNPEKLISSKEIPEVDRMLAEELLFHPSDETLARFTTQYT
jgi:5-methyltetrahydrofolate--homocysteine methyltransferase